MANTTAPRRFRTNPVEIAVLAIASMFFLHAVYNLFYDGANYRPGALSPMSASPTSEGRGPASVSQSFLNIEIKCDGTKDQDTTASKVRLTGVLCGIDSPVDGSKVVRTLVINNANKFNATVFTDPNAGKFSTDYIPLNSGKNPVHLEFSYRDGKSVTQDFVVNKD